MSKLEIIERQVKDLNPSELKEFRDWFMDFEATSWDLEIESDVTAGKLDVLAERALSDYAAGRSTKKEPFKPSTWPATARCRFA